MSVTTNPVVTGIPTSPFVQNARVATNGNVTGIPATSDGTESTAVNTNPLVSGHVENRSVRQALTNMLRDGFTVANYQPGIGVTGVSAASVWANQIGVAGSLAQGTAAAQPLYLPFDGTKYAYCPPIASNCFTTPNSAAIGLTGDIEFIVRAAFTDLATVAQLMMISEYDGAAGFHFGTFPGTNKLYLHNNGVNNQSSVTLASLGLTNGAFYYWKANRVAATGVCTFAYSVDGVTYTAIGVPVGATAGAALPGTSGLAVAGHVTPTVAFNGKIARAQLLSGIGGTVVADWNAADWSEISTNGATQVSLTTGETWTLTNTAVANPAAIVASPYIVTDELAKFMQVAYAANQPRSIDIVGMHPLWAAGKYIADGVTANTLGIAKTTATPKISVNAGLAAAENAEVTLRAKHVIQIILNGANSSISVDGGTATTGNAGAGNPGGLTIGADGGSVNFGGFWFSEIIDRAVADDATTQAHRLALLKELHNI